MNNFYIDITGQGDDDTLPAFHSRAGTLHYLNPQGPPILSAGVAEWIGPPRRGTPTDVYNWALTACGLTLINPTFKRAELQGTEAHACKNCLRATEKWYAGDPRPL